MGTAKYYKQKKVSVVWSQLTGARADRLKKLFTSTPMNWQYVTYGRKAA